MTRAVILSSGTAVLAAFLAVGCGGSSDPGNPSGPTAATPTPTPTPTPAGSGGTQSTSVAYVQDIQPILQADCARCHGGFRTYQGTMDYVRPGDAGSPLVAVTQPGGMMYSHLSGNAAEKSDLIRRWVVDNGAVESR